MKNLSLILNGLLLIAVIVLYVLFFKQKNTTAPPPKIAVAAPVPNGGIRIGYFNMDSLEQNYQLIKDTHSQLTAQQENIGRELNTLRSKYMARVQSLQQKQNTMSQQEGEQAQAEINQMQTDLQQKEAQLSQQLQDRQYKSLQDINKKIEDFLKTYNQQRGYAFVFSHQPGDNIFYRDSMYNITSDIVEGLNADYNKKDK